MFTASYKNSVDTKGRLSIPSAFRSALGGEDYVVLWPSFELKCLEGGGRALLKSYSKALQAMSPYDSTRQAITHAVFGRAREYALDSTGRIVLDSEQVAFVGLDRKSPALLVGLGDRFQIWNPQHYPEIRDGYVQTALERSGQFGALGTMGAGG